MTTNLIAVLKYSIPYLRHNSNAASAAKHKVVTFEVPFLSPHAEVIGGSLQACSCAGSWEHGGYLCLALPDICYVTYVNKVRVRVRVTGYELRRFTVRFFIGLGLALELEGWG